jgi:hypothetical protein
MGETQASGQRSDPAGEETVEVGAELEPAVKEGAGQDSKSGDAGELEGKSAELDTKWNGEPDTKTTGGPKTGGPKTKWNG